MPTKAKYIDKAALDEWFDYDPLTGVFLWKKRPERGGKSCRVGDVAGSMQAPPNGGRPRRILFLKGKKITAARAAFVMVHGSIPDGALIDHANGDPSDDRIENLRLASHVQNVWNALSRPGSKMARGVSRSAKGQFKARIQMQDGSRVNLGTWPSEAEAHAAYMGAAAILHGDFHIGLRPAKAQNAG